MRLRPAPAHRPRCILRWGLCDVAATSGRVLRALGASLEVMAAFFGACLVGMVLTRPSDTAADAASQGPWGAGSP